MSVITPRWFPTVCKVIQRVSRVLDHLAAARVVNMNTHLFHGMQQYPPCSFIGAGYLPPPFFPPGAPFNYPNQPRNYPYYRSDKFHEFMQVTLCQQFLQVYNFNNSERFHPKVSQKSFERSTHRSREVKVRRSASSSDLNYDLQSDDLLVLQTRKLTLSGSVESVAESSGSNQSLGSSKTGSESTDYADSVPDDISTPSDDLNPPSDIEGCAADDDFSGDSDSDGDMHPRGIKRQPDQRTRSPIQKRPRSEERPPGAPAPKGPWSIRQGGFTKEEYQKISDEILDFYEKREQAQGLYVKKMKLRDALYEVMRGVFPYCGLYVVGSSMNGFGSHESDMDLCLMLSYNEIDQKKEATEILRILCKALKKCSFLKELNLIRAKVPILKFVDKISNVECDLNINNSVGIRNTHLLNAYSKLDWRVSCLVLYVKHWAKSQNINDASQGTISSYSIVLMVIHYLQCGCSPPVVPSLQMKYPHKFDVNTDIRLLTLNEKLPPYNSPNKDSLGELFVGFLEYYSHKFDFADDAISIRLGRRLPKPVVMKQNPILNPISQWKCICIEEPFNLSNTARSVFDPFTFEHIRQVIRKSYSVLRQKTVLSAIINQPL